MTSIQIVDDRVEIVTVFEDFLEFEDYEVVGAAMSGKDAISLYKQTMPDVVLMDILMPGMSGNDAAREIIKFDPDARIIAVTAFGREGLREECMDAGCIGFISKPFDMADLLDAINAAVSDGGK